MKFLILRIISVFSRTKLFSIENFSSRWLLNFGPGSEEWLLGLIILHSYDNTKVKSKNGHREIEFEKTSEMQKEKV